MPSKYGREVPNGYVKTSFEISEDAKDVLYRLKGALRREQDGVSEASIVEALILTAKKYGVDAIILAKAIRDRKKAQEREET